MARRSDPARRVKVTSSNRFLIFNRIWLADKNHRPAKVNIKKLYKTLCHTFTKQNYKRLKFKNMLKNGFST